MVVRLDVLKRVYDGMQNSTGEEFRIDDKLDTEAHLYFIDAFDIPLWHWSTERNAFEK
jgi:DNA polymerase epsilon subunit 2